MTCAPYVFYGLASRLTSKMFEWYATHDEAERVREEILRDEPDLAAVIYVAEVDLSGVPVPTRG